METTDEEKTAAYLKFSLIEWSEYLLWNNFTKPFL